LSDPEDNQGREMRVIVEGGKQEVESYKELAQKMMDERDEANQLIQDLAQKTYDEYKEKVKSQVDEAYHEEIDDMTPDELTGFVSGMEKRKEIKKMSIGSVGLITKPTEDFVDELMSREFSTQQEMVNALYKTLGMQNLTPSQKRRLKTAQDKLWEILRNQPIVSKRITRKTKYDGKPIYLIKCRICQQEIPQDIYPEHFEEHVQQRISKGGFSGDFNW